MADQTRRSVSLNAVICEQVVASRGMLLRHVPPALAVDACGNSLWVRIVKVHMTPTKLGLAALRLTLGTAASCSSSPRPAVLSGVATPCVGLVTQDQYVQMPVHVVLSEGAHTVTSQIVRGSHTYRFKVAPGLYVVSSDQSTVAPTRVTLRSGQIAHVNLSTHCKWGQPTV
jgi:hypothetical protein